MSSGTLFRRKLLFPNCTAILSSIPNSIQLLVTEFTLKNPLENTCLKGETVTFRTRRTLTENVASNLNNYRYWRDFVEIKTLEDEDHLNGTPTAGKNDHNDDHLEEWKACDFSSIESPLDAVLFTIRVTFFLERRLSLLFRPGTLCSQRRFNISRYS